MIVDKQCNKLLRQSTTQGQSPFGKQPEGEMVLDSVVRGGKGKLQAKANCIIIELLLVITDKRSNYMHYCVASCVPASFISSFGKQTRVLYARLHNITITIWNVLYFLLSLQFRQWCGQSFQDNKHIYLQSTADAGNGKISFPFLDRFRDISFLVNTQPTSVRSTWRYFLSLRLHLYTPCDE